MGPQTEAAENLHSMKYRIEGETFRDYASRAALALRDEMVGDTHYHELRQIFGHQRFLPGGRVQRAAGTGSNVTYYNCFVSDTIQDDFESILMQFNDAMRTMRMGGGIGYDFSTMRPKGDRIKSLGSTTGGPMAFAPIFNSGCESIASAGHRRGAQMLVLRIDHPDVELFINSKHDNTSLTAFNISLGVTDAFMEALFANKPFTLQFGGKPYKEIDPVALWETVMRSTWDFAEPGALFIDTINRMNNLYYCETIAATNPCGEQPLPPHGACLLGSFNLTKYMTKQPVSVSDLQAGKRSPGWNLDMDMLEADIPAVVSAMDNVVDRSKYPLEAQRLEAVNKRRMGLGVTGLANALEAMGLPYGSPEFLKKEAEVLFRINDGCYRASALIAKEKGAFPLFDADKYLASKFVSSEALSDEARDLIRRYGIRNSHLTSIAPTGTISQCADNVSGGLEPLFDFDIDRPINTPEGPRIVNIKDYGLQFFGVRGKTAAEVTVEEHLAVQVVAQKYVDSAVSKTCNLTGATPWPKFKALYENAWRAGCKGITTFNSDGKRMALLESKKEPTAAACFIDPSTGQKECG